MVTAADGQLIPFAFLCLTLHERLEGWKAHCGRLQLCRVPCLAVEGYCLRAVAVKDHEAGQTI